MSLSDDGGSGTFDTQVCTTVGEFIADVIVKELCALWLRHDARSFDIQAVQSLMARIGPSVATDILEMARSWVPQLRDIGLDDLVPDLHQYPNPIEDVEGLDLKQQQLILESFEVILTNMDFGKMYELNRVPEEALPRPLTFPKDTVACIAAQITVVFERMCVNLSCRRENVGFVLGEEDEFKRQDATQVVSGSKQELIFQLQTCRRRIFDLERELVTKERSFSEKLSWEIKERNNKVSHLMEVNVYLEEKLRQRTEENRQAELQLLDAQRRVEHAHSLLADRRTQTEKLETALAKSCRMQEDILEREREHGKRILRARVDEHVTVMKDRLRITQLRKTLRTPFGPEGDEAEEYLKMASERDLTNMANEALSHVQEEFEDFFLRRQERFEEMLADYEMKLEDKKRQYEILSGDIARGEHAQHFGSGRVKNAAVQTNFASMASGLPSSPVVGKSEPVRTPRSMKGKKSMRADGSVFQANIDIPALFSPTQKRVSTPSTRASSIQPSRATSRCDNSRPGSSMDTRGSALNTPRPASRNMAPVLRSSSRQSTCTPDGRASPMPPRTTAPFQRANTDSAAAASRPSSGSPESARRQNTTSAFEVSGGPPPPGMPAPPPPVGVPQDMSS